MSKFKESFIKHVVSVKNGYPRTNLVAPAYGLDTSIIDISPDLSMAVASDPLSFIPRLGPKMSAWLSIHLVANDIATTSLTPDYGQVVLNVPDSLQEEDILIYWDYIHQYANDIGLSITGGHTGWCNGNQSTIAGGITLWTFASRNKMLLSSGAQIGDILLMTKSAAISSSAILAIVFAERLEKSISIVEMQQLQDGFWNTSVLQEAKIVQKFNAVYNAVTAMHDVTEGGVIGAIHEFCSSSRLGISVQESLIYIAPHIQKVCDLLDMDPLRSIGAGCMLMSCKPEYKDMLIEEMRSQGVECTAIGHFVPMEDGKSIHAKGGGVIPLEGVEKDPYWNVFYNLMNNDVE